MLKAAESYRDFIAGETLAREYEAARELTGTYAAVRDVEVDGVTVRIGLAVA